MTMRTELNSDLSENSTIQNYKSGEETHFEKVRIKSILHQ